MLPGVQASGGVPAGLIEQDDGVAPGATTFEISTRWRFMAKRRSGEIGPPRDGSGHDANAPRADRSRVKAGGRWCYITD